MVSPSHPASGITGILLTILNDSSGQGSAGQGSAYHDIIGHDSDSPGLLLLLHAAPDRLARAGGRMAAAGLSTVSGERLVAAFGEIGAAGADVAVAVKGRAGVGPGQAQDPLQLPVVALDAPTPRRATYSPAQARLPLGTPPPSRGQPRPASLRPETMESTHTTKRPRSLNLSHLKKRVTRIELALSAWEADVLPLNYTRTNSPRRDPVGDCSVTLPHRGRPVSEVGWWRGGEGGGSGCVARELGRTVEARKRS